MERFGRGDEEKRACGLLDTPAPCTIISIGNNNIWGFEHAVSRATRCHTHVFDCTIDPRTRVPAAIADRVTLYRLCIATRTHNRTRGGEARPMEFLRYEELLARAGLTSAPAFLKMDVEGYAHTWWAHGAARGAYSCWYHAWPRS